MDSVGSRESADGPRNKSGGNRDLRGIESLKDVASATKIVSSFKHCQSSAKNDSSKKFTKKSVAHPLRVTQKQSDAAMEVAGHKEAASVTVQSVSLNHKPPSEDVIFRWQLDKYE